MESSERKADEPRHDRLGSHIKVQTLLIASVASAAATFAVARIWGGGTLIGAAAAPVIVALVSEFLRRPVETVTETAKRIPAAQIMPHVSGRSTSAVDPTRVYGDPPSASADSAPVPAPPAPEEPPPAPGASTSTAGAPVVTSGTPGPAAPAVRWRPNWRVAVITGSVAFMLVAGLYTVTDLVVGRSVTGNGQPTTLFGSAKAKTSTTKTVTTTTPLTVTKTTTVPTTSTTTTTTTPTTSTATQTAPQTSTITTPSTTTSTTPTTTTTPTVPAP